MNRPLKILVVFVLVSLFFIMTRSSTNAFCWEQTTYEYSCKVGCTKTINIWTCCNYITPKADCEITGGLKSSCTAAESCTYCNINCPPPPCEPGNCTGCTPSTPSGYTSSNNGCSISTTRTCTGNNGCDSCTISKRFWLIETNTTPNLPSNLTMTIDGQQYTLTTDSNNPTTVKYPSTLNDVQVTIPSMPAPPTSGGLGYAIRANNYGINNEWLAWTNCSSPRPEDFCYEGSNNTTNFTPTSLSILDTLKQNAKGQISGLYYTVNRCNTSTLYSLPLETYYTVNNNPIIEPPSVVDVNAEDFKGCYTSDYTGTRVNNPLNIRIPVSDPDGNEEIEGVVVWFSKSGNTPELPLITSTYTSTDTDEVGVMIHKNGNSWNNPNVYAINENNTWGPISDDLTIQNDGNNIARILNIEVVEGSDFAFNFDLEILTNLSSQMDGIYDFKVQALDEYMILSSGRVDISHMQTYFQWGIDLVEPRIEDLEQEVLGAQELFLNWQALGTGSNITDIVINGYRTSAFVEDDISLLNPSGYSPLSLSAVPPESEIGQLNDLNSWRYQDLNTTPYIDNSNTRINIGDNEGGSVILYVTAFDQGCNATPSYHNIDLNPWIATKGGMVYSQGNLGSSAKNVSSVPSLAIRNILKEHIDTGTELVSSRALNLSNLIHPDLGAVRASNIVDSNSKKTFWYSYLKDKLDERLPLLTQFDMSNPCTGENCVMISDENITIPSDYECNKNTLFISEQDILIEPNITETSGNQSTTGCIFLAKNNIQILEGGRESTTDVGYDYIEGFMIAENQIHITPADLAEPIRDGLEIKGGVVAMGRDLTDMPSILLERNLRLFNYSHPTMVVSWDIKYARLSEIFFGTEAPMYKQEVGFKAF